jgi:pimeloyl-ACP methyl ester carboxylesterase
VETSIQIPCDDFGGDGPALHFTHANGYPPRAYAPLLQRMTAHYHVFAMHLKPLWSQSSPTTLHDWQPFADDLLQFLQRRQQWGLIGVGHSIGGATTLRVALRAPDLFRAVILLDPVILPLNVVHLWKMLTRLGLAQWVLPLARRTRKRQKVFESREAMFACYRDKGVFRDIDNIGLHAIVAALIQPRPDGKVELVYPPEWETQIYTTGLVADVELWRQLPTLKPPLLVIHGENSEVFREKTGLLFKRCLPNAIIHGIPNAGHLVPFEQPVEVFRLMQEFLC